MPRSYELALIPPEIRLQKLMFADDEDGNWPPPRTARELADLLRVQFGIRMGPAEVESILENSPAYQIVPGPGLRRWCAAGKAPAPAIQTGIAATPSDLSLPPPARCPLDALAKGELSGGTAILAACGVEVWEALEAAGPPAKVIFLADTPGGLAAERDYLARAATGLEPWSSVSALAVTWGGDLAAMSAGALGGLAAKVISESADTEVSPILVLPADADSATNTADADVALATFSAFTAAGGVRTTIVL